MLLRQKLLVEESIYHHHQGRGHHLLEGSWDAPEAFAIVRQGVVAGATDEVRKRSLCS